VTEHAPHGPWRRSADELAACLRLLLADDQDPPAALDGRCQAALRRYDQCVMMAGSRAGQSPRGPADPGRAADMTGPALPPSAWLPRSEPAPPGESIGAQQERADIEEAGW